MCRTGVATIKRTRRSIHKARREDARRRCPRPKKQSRQTAARMWPLCGEYLRWRPRSVPRCNSQLAFDASLRRLCVVRPLQHRQEPLPAGRRHAQWWLVTAGSMIIGAHGRPDGSQSYAVCNIMRREPPSKYEVKIQTCSIWENWPLETCSAEF